MNPGNDEDRRVLGGGLREDQAAGGSRSVVKATAAPAPRVAGRLDTYRSRSSKWHRQVKVDQCPKCGHPHLHRAPLPLVQTVVKLAPCGLEYIVVLRPQAVSA